MARRGHPDEIDVSGDFSAVEQEGGRCNSGVPVWGARVWPCATGTLGSLAGTSWYFYPEKHHVAAALLFIPHRMMEADDTHHQDWTELGGTGPRARKETRRGSTGRNWNVCCLARWPALPQRYDSRSGTLLLVDG